MEEAGKFLDEVNIEDQREKSDVIKRLDALAPGKSSIIDRQIPEFISLIQEARNPIERDHIVKQLIQKIRGKNETFSFAEQKGLDILNSWLDGSATPESIKRNILRTLIKMRTRFPVSSMEESGIFKTMNGLAYDRAYDSGLREVCDGVLSRYGRGLGVHQSSWRQSKNGGKKKSLQWNPKLEQEKVFSKYAPPNSINSSTDAGKSVSGKSKRRPSPAANSSGSTALTWSRPETWMGIPLEQFQRGQKSQESIFQMKREESRLGRFYHHEEEIPEDPISASFFPVNDEDVLRVPYSMKKKAPEMTTPQLEKPKAAERSSIDSVQIEALYDFLTGDERKRKRQKFAYAPAPAGFQP
eukprot:CAMPEP_0197520142 /NCGR_PEP_ID=MMETSP1318-20131121/5452_1 /TAXON_ID=552666 /ORGANISM="Partenskyella glossopodia, Strain RCC365" /LENGTH=354 /DNA_ID=CAMNT_0043071531 /DNA_START=170 /DNA_END=1231 /DNA_ORIENTATION=-